MLKALGLDKDKPAKAEDISRHKGLASQRAQWQNQADTLKDILHRLGQSYASVKNDFALSRYEEIKSMIKDSIRQYHLAEEQFKRQSFKQRLTTGSVSASVDRDRKGSFKQWLMGGPDSASDDRKGSMKQRPDSVSSDQKGSSSALTRLREAAEGLMSSNEQNQKRENDNASASGARNRSVKQRPDSASSDRRASSGAMARLREAAEGFVSSNERIQKKDNDYARLSTKQAQSESEQMRKDVMQFKQDYYGYRDRLQLLEKNYEDSKKLDPTKRYNVLKTMVKDATRS